MVNEFWDRKYGEGNYEWELDPSPVGVLALTVARKHGYKTVIDIGSGYGRDTLYLAGAGHGLDVVGIDNSREGIEMGIELARRRALNVEFRLADALIDPIGPGSYDMVIMSYTRHLLLAQDRQKLLSRVRDILRPGGRVIDMVPSIKDGNYGMGSTLEEGTYSLRGKALHFFTGEEMLKDYEGFEIDSLDEVEIEEKHSDGRLHNHWTWMLVAVRQGTVATTSTVSDDMA